VLLPTRLLLLALLALLPGCGKPHVLVVGLDGANWVVLDPLIDAGYLPTIGAIVRGGARAGLHCAPAHPAMPCFCPPVWTSIATGRPFSQHGLSGLYTPSYDRRFKAIWNVLGEHGGTATLSSFRGTWPPEPGVDFVFTEPGLDASGEAHFDVWGEIDHPAHAEADPLFEPPDVLERLGIEPPEGSVPPVWGIHARDRIAMEALLRLVVARGVPEPWERKTELTMITIHGPDKVAHLLWGSLQDRMYGPVEVAPLLAGAGDWDGPVELPGPFGWGPIAGPYLEVDAWLGRLLAAHPFDYVVLLSDHGMTRNPVAGFAGSHDITSPEAHIGILAMSGPGLRSGAWLGVVSVLDVAPTLAYLLDLPVPGDLPGRVLGEAFQPGFLAIRPVDANATGSWE
jgi:hypothetical protein